MYLRFLLQRVKRQPTNGLKRMMTGACGAGRTATVARLRAQAQR